MKAAVVRSKATVRSSTAPTDVTGTIELPEGVEMVRRATTSKWLLPRSTRIAMDDGLRFAIREGGRTAARALLLKLPANYSLIVLN